MYEVRSEVSEALAFFFSPLCFNKSSIRPQSVMKLLALQNVLGKQGQFEGIIIFNRHSLTNVGPTFVL